MGWGGARRGEEKEGATGKDKLLQKSDRHISKKKLGIIQHFSSMKHWGGGSLVIDIGC